MSASLQADYEAWLAASGLRPRRLPAPEEIEAGRLQMTRARYRQAKSVGDPLAEDLWLRDEAMRRAPPDPQYPMITAIEEAGAEIEATILAIPSFASLFRTDVLVREFPTGSINCQVVRTANGYLVLVNSGAAIVLHQVANFLWRRDPDQPDGAASREAIMGVAAILAEYVRSGDPFYGPKPVTGGAEGYIAARTADAGLTFLVAHEYAHILAGHLEDAPVETLETPEGGIEVLSKARDQELEADEMAYRLTLGVGRYEDVDLAAIDAAYDSQDPARIPDAIALRTRLVSPFLPLVLDTLLGRFHQAAGGGPGSPADASGHPDGKLRVQRVWEKLPSRRMRHVGLAEHPLALLDASDQVIAHMREFLAAPPADPEPAEPADPDAGERLMAVAEHLVSGEDRKALLAMLDAFDADRSLNEPDGDLLLREHLRGGSKSGVRTILLDRQAERRMAEAFLNGQMASPLTAHLRSMGGPSSMSVTDLPPRAPPLELDLVDWLLAQEGADDPPSRQGRLMRCLSAAWRGDGAATSAALRSALGAGAADPGSRLARLAHLLERASDLGVALDLQRMRVEVARRVFSNPEEAPVLARLVSDFAAAFDVGLDPMTQRMIEVQLDRGRGRAP